MLSASGVSADNDRRRHDRDDDRPFHRDDDRPFHRDDDRPFHRDDDRPFEYTERRSPCDDYDKFKQPFFGVLHLHTGRSFDAALRFVRGTPRQAYKFAKGEGKIITPNQFGIQRHETWIDRPLDFLGITDHSEYFGEMGLCSAPAESESAGRQSLECALLGGYLSRARVLPIPAFARELAAFGFSIIQTPGMSSATHNVRTPVCNANPKACAAAELTVWHEMQRAAKRAYDKTSACRFTSFVAYENTAMPSAVTHHKNVIFRNDDVIRRPITAIDIARRPNPDPLHQTVSPSWIGNVDSAKLWRDLKDQCNSARGRCEALIIPHNTNLSTPVGLTETVMGDPPGEPLPDGSASEEQIANAHLMAEMQPLIEIYQDKGASECRNDPRFRAAVYPDFANTPWLAQTGLAEEDANNPGEPDEYCSFELLDAPGGAAAAGLAAGSAPFPSEFADRAYVRNILKDGLAMTEKYGINPFKLGIGASQDEHNARPGFTPEDASFDGHSGIDDVFPTRASSTIQNSSGGLWVAWAEENSRDSIFTALKNKETYATSGTRPKVRFFGGWDYSINACEQNFAKSGYRDGVPMGGTLPERTMDVAPRFIAAAWMDEGSPSTPGTGLQRIQIIKGWLDSAGATHEAVFDVAVTDGDQGDAFSQSCEVAAGSEHLCAVWEDPLFDPEQEAFYYVRVLENPVCRYSTHICLNAGVDPFDDENCKDQLALLPDPGNGDYSGLLPACEEDHTSEACRAEMALIRGPNRGNHALCCASDRTGTAPLVERKIQERAWTSPIWYSALSGG
jgi:hypothetical protein